MRGVVAGVGHAAVQRWFAGRRIAYAPAAAAAISRKTPVTSRAVRRPETRPPPPASTPPDGVGDRFGFTVGSSVLPFGSPVVPVPGPPPGPPVPGLPLLGLPLPGPEPGPLVPGLPLPGPVPGPPLPGPVPGPPLPGPVPGPPLLGPVPGPPLLGPVPEPSLLGPVPGPLLLGPVPEPLLLGPLVPGLPVPGLPVPGLPVPGPPPPGPPLLGLGPWLLLGAATGGSLSPMLVQKASNVKSRSKASSKPAPTAMIRLRCAVFGARCAGEPGPDMASFRAVAGMFVCGGRDLRRRWWDTLAARWLVCSLLSVIGHFGRTPESEADGSPGRKRTVPRAGSGRFAGPGADGSPGQKWTVRRPGSRRFAGPGQDGFPGRERWPLRRDGVVNLGSPRARRMRAGRAA
ncbi:hypothetical protein J3R03_005778 [Actinoplanes couchii]|nr:hypothetical protein [Actinoplanes couchii]